MGKIRVSASALENFFTCPAKYAFSQNFTSLEKKPWLQWGSDAHDLMEGKVLEQPSRQGVKYFKALDALRKKYGYQITHQELTQIVDLTDNVELIRRIDAIDPECLIDWKTASKAWTEVQMDGWVAMPKGMTFQAASYLLPPREEDWEGPWRERIDFVVSTGQRMTYYRNPADEANLIEAAEHLTWAIKRDIMVKHRGYPCDNCDFLALCYEQPGWQKLYKVRGGNHD